jgi:hypothetical protein
MYMHRDCSDAKEPEDDEIISGERLTKGTLPGEHVPIGSRIWLVSRVLATFASALMRTCSLMHSSTVSGICLFKMIQISN